MIRVVVHTTIVSVRSQSGLLWFVVEVDCESIEEVHRRFLDDGCIFGHKLIAFVQDGNRRIISRREPIIVSKNVLATAALCSFDYEEAAE